MGYFEDALDRAMESTRQMEREIIVGIIQGTPFKYFEAIVEYTPDGPVTVKMPDEAQFKADLIKAIEERNKEVSE